MWGKSVQIYPIFRCIKWNNHEKSSIWNTKCRNNRRLSILYTEMWGKSVQIYPIFRCIKWNNHEKSSIWNTKYRNNRRLSVLYTEMWGKSVQIYPIFRCIKWNNQQISSIWNTKYRNNRRLSILYTEMWGKSVQIYPIFRCIKWNNQKNLIFETRNTETIEDYPFYTPKCGSSIWNTKYRNNRRLSILYTEMWGKHIWKTFHFIQGEFHKHLCCL